MSAIHGPTLAPECTPIPAGHPRAGTWTETTCVWCLRNGIGLKKQRLKDTQRRLDKANSRLDDIREAAEEWRVEELEHIQDQHYGIAEGLNVAATAVEKILVK